MVKFLVLSLFTMGGYTAYWMYRNWKTIKQKEQNKLMPIARAIFGIIWFYPLFSALKKDSVERFDNNKVMLPVIATLFCFSLFVVSVTENHIEYEACRYNSSWNIQSIVAIILYLSLLGFVIAQETPLIPSDSVVSQNDIMQHDIKYLYRQDVVSANETIHYFYSDGFLSIRDDGNGVTDEHVFSYWQDDNDGLKVEKATFKNIKDIKVKHADKKDEYTIITIIRLDDST